MTSLRALSDYTKLYRYSGDGGEILHSTVITDFSIAQDGAIEDTEHQ